MGPKWFRFEKPEIKVRKVKINLKGDLSPLIEYE